MSDTIVDMAKVTQMLDAGWQVALFKNEMRSYTAAGRHENTIVWENAKSRLLTQLAKDGVEFEMREAIREEDWDEPGEITTDDFTPEQALTRLSYKVHGEIL